MDDFDPFGSLLDFTGKLSTQYANVTDSRAKAQEIANEKDRIAVDKERLAYEEKSSTLSSSTKFALSGFEPNTMLLLGVVVSALIYVAVKK